MPRMPDNALQGVGVLVTRPRTQAADLVAAIEKEGGTTYCFPVIDIAALDQTVVSAAASRLPKPDIVIFISRNAVEYGLQYTSGSKIAVIGPATAEAVAAAGHIVDIQPASGYDSEHLLAEIRAADGRRQGDPHYSRRHRTGVTRTGADRAWR